MDVDNVLNRHLESFAWKADTIPLGIWVNDKKKYGKVSFEKKDFYKRLFERQMTILEDTKTLDSDLIPVLGITNYGIAVVPSVFGAELIMSNSDVDRIEEVGYWVHNLFNNIESVEKFVFQEKDKNFFYDVYRHIEYYRKNAPEGVHISNSLDGPFSIAEILRGSDIYYDIYDKPEYVHMLMDLCTDAVIECEHELKKAAGYKDYKGDFPSYFGIWTPGLRLGDDSIINLSEEMIKEFVIPYYIKIAKRFDCKLNIHFCSVTKPIGEQIIRAFKDCDEIVAVSTQLGTQLYEKNYEIIKGKLAIESGYGDAFKFYADKYGSLKKWFERLRKANEGKRGLIMYTTVDSLDEGKKIIEEWNNVWDRPLW